MQTSHFQTPSLVVNLLFICIIGLFFLLMLSSELVAIVEAQSLYDHVSGALNRRGIDQRLALEVVRAERNGYQLAVALIDIDHFKQINDTAGHAAGDAALKQVVEVISSRLRSYDFFGRYGGDEFLLVIPQTSCEDALRIAERIEHAVGRLTVSRFGLPITLSIGLTFAAPGETAVSMLARADMALYNAKHAGRNCTRVLMASMDGDSMEKVETCEGSE
jgi:diguanylate cyclase (GGDEF)-like protein